jgi:hypothetical protein
MGEPNFYILMSYVQGLVQLEVLRRAIESGDISRTGVLAALRTVKGWNAGGIIQPVDLSTVPYVTGTQTRILAPDVARRSWTQVAGYASPAAMEK